MTNITDLREMLAEKAETVAATGSPTTSDRVFDARGRARSIRKRWVAAAGAAVVTVAAIVAGIAVPTVLTADGPDPATDVDMDLPTYARGGKLIGETTINLPDTEGTITVTPEADLLLLSAKCDTELQVTLTYGEGNLYGSSCGGESMWGWGADIDNSEFGIELGEPLTLGVIVGASREGEEDVKPPDTGTVRLGIYDSVPWNEYEFPEPPKELIDPDDMFGDGSDLSDSHRLIESAEDPNEPVTFQFEGDAFDLEIKTQTPGIIRVFINGEETAVEHFWNYDGVPFQTEQVQYTGDLDRSWEPYEDPVEVTLVPEEFTGEWRALLTECELDADGNGLACGP